MTDEASSNGAIYKLHGLPITPVHIRQLVVELFAGQSLETHQIVNVVEQTHRERGGAASRAADFSRQVRKALSYLREVGLAENPATGFWRIAPSAAKRIDEPVTQLPEEEELDSSDHVDAEIIIGSGASSVYLYYFPAYRILATHNRHATWPCKIGRSDRDPLNRIYSQASTAIPEPPIIGILLRTNLPSQWEKAIHNTLALRGRIIEDAPGDEWFNTSIDEVLDIIRYIDPSLVLVGQSNDLKGD